MLNFLKFTIFVNVKFLSRPPIMNGYGSSSSHEVKAEDLSAGDAQDVKPNLYALKNEMQASDYSNKGTFCLSMYLFLIFCIIR